MTTFLPQNQFLPNPAMPTAGSAVPSDLPPVIGGTAAPFDKPTPNEGRSDGAPALDAPPNAHEDAGATDCISEIFHYARKLMTHQPRFELDEAAFMAAIKPMPSRRNA